VNILTITSEAVPLAKTGGLADVCGALPVELARLGHRSTVILPAYRATRYCGLPIEPMGIEFIVPVGSKMVSGRLLQTSLGGGLAPVYLVEQDQYFDRDQLYGEDDKDYPDNCERFVFFSRAAMEAIRLLDLHVDVIHAHDWQTGLVPAYLKTEYQHVPRYQRTAALMTIHNLA
jgi:starch synthase